MRTDTARQLEVMKDKNEQYTPDIIRTIYFDGEGQNVRNVWYMK
jgi:hypothetical protein